MPVTAAIKLTQGVTTDAAGRSLIGVLTTPVTASNGDDTGVVFWRWEVLDVPAASAVATGVRTEGSLQTLVFSPDARGGYMLRLTTRDKLGNQAVDQRVFQVLEASGRLIPPLGGDDRSLNFAGQTRGWAKYEEQWLHYVDTIVGGGLSFEDEGISTGPTRSILNFVGAGVTAVDNPGAGRVDVTVPGGVSASRLQKDVSAGGTFTLTSLESSASIVELVGTPAADVTVVFTAVDARENRVVSKVTSTRFIVFLKAAASTAPPLVLNRYGAVDVYCDGVDLQYAGPGSRMMPPDPSGNLALWYVGNELSGTTMFNRGYAASANLTAGVGTAPAGGGNPIYGDSSWQFYDNQPTSTIAATGVPAFGNPNSFQGSFAMKFGGPLGSAAQLFELPGVFKLSMPGGTVGTTAGRLDFAVNTTGGTKTSLSTPDMYILDNQWHLISFKYVSASGQVQIFVDGTFVSNAYGALNPTWGSWTNAITLGGIGGGFYGSIADVRLYDGGGSPPSPDYQWRRMRGVLGAP